MLRLHLLPPRGPSAGHTVRSALLGMLLVSVMSSAILTAGCRTSNAPAITRAPAAPPAAPVLAHAEPVAVQAIDAPGFNVHDLTARLRDGIARTSGVPVVDEISVRAEIAACVELPCPEEQQERFRSARYVAAATVSKIGSGFLGSARVLLGAREVARASARGPDPGALVEELGWELGRQLRAALQVAPATAPPPPEIR